MAIMIPPIPYKTGSKGEEHLFEALEKLDDSYFVIHSYIFSSNLTEKKMGSVIGEVDFVIVHKSFGILIVEVKGGEVEITESGWIQRNRNSQTINSTDPIRQAQLNQVNIFNEMIKPLLSAKEFFPVGHIVWLPDCEKSGSLMDTMYEHVLDEHNKRLPAIAIKKAFQNLEKRWGRKIIVEESTFKKIIGRFYPETSCAASIMTDFQKREKDFIILKEQQNQVYLRLQESKMMLVHGRAGTGKTIIAIELAKNFASKGGRVLFLSFNKKLIEYSILLLL